ncbi:hypothetical protein UACE39S_04182 [Ureibacillus acetophenoni]
MKTFEVQYLESKSGEITLKINDFFVHSKYNPNREAKQIAEKQYIPHYTHIIFGYGRGYLAEALLQQFKFDEVLIVIDPLLENGTLTIRKEHEQFNIFNKNAIENLEFIVGTLAEETRTTFNIICLSNYDKLFPELYKKLLVKVKGIQYQNRTNDYTLMRYAESWQVNFIKNLYHLSNDVSLAKLEQIYDCPVVIAFGGPSLSKQIEQLKKVRDSIILIAAGSTINSLLAAEIEPDYVVSIDGGVPNFNHFKDLKLEKAHLIYSMQNHPGVREAFLKNGYCLDIKGLYGFSKYLKEQVKVNLPQLDGGGTVAHVCFTIAQYISTGPIALIGQDLAYTDNLTHAANNKNAREIDEMFIKEYEAFQVEGYNEDLVYTNPMYYSMKLEFEQMIKMNPPTVPFFNCTEGGIKLLGYEQLTFLEFCNRFIKKSKVVIIEHQDDDALNFNVESLLKQDLSNYRKLLNNLRDGLSTLAMNRSTVQFEPRVLKKLDQIDMESRKLFEQLPLDSITNPITMNITRHFLPKLNETPEEMYLRVKNQTKTLYKKLTEAIQFAKRTTEEILKEHSQSEDSI